MSTSYQPAHLPVHLPVHLPGPSVPHLLAGTQSAQAAPGVLHLTLQGNRVLDNPSPPRVHLNGYPVALTYGTHAISVPAGRLEVDVHCRLLRRYGDARLTVDVPPGGAVALFYAPPHHELTHGRLGHEPQRRAGAPSALVLALLSLGLMAALLLVLLR